MCQQIPIDQTHYFINMHASTLPNFILHNEQAQTYMCCNMSKSIKQHLTDTMNGTYLEDHPELELTRFNSEINWQASVWPIKNKNYHNHPKIDNFQYKLKTNSLLTPADRFHLQIDSTKLPTPTIPFCSVCQKVEEEADIKHIFSNCTIAQTENNEMWVKIAKKIPELENIGVWFSYSGELQHNEFKAGHWKKINGNYGYIPSRILHKLSKENKRKLTKIVAKSRYNIWIQYWKKYKEIIQTSTNKEQPISIDDSDTDEPLNVPVVNSAAPKKSQATLLQFFSKTK
jgi:hypothetical protein